ncbi:MAG: CesT family type III secretion system chaperone [Thermodesulforhabdaceae bacterium]
MSWVKEALQALGRQLGIENLRTDEKGLCLLQEGSDTFIGIEDREDTVLLYISRETNFLDKEVMEKALQSTFYRSLGSNEAGVCLTRDSRLTFFSHIPRSSVTFPRLSETLGLLRKLLLTSIERR